MKLAEEKQGKRKIKLDDDDEILSYDWIEEITINRRLPIQMWTSIN